MTAESLESLRKLVELAAKATPGPWTKIGSAKRTLFTTAQGQQTVAPDKAFLPVEIVTCLRHAEQAQADCDFIAAARNAIPALESLLAEMKREPVAWRAWQTADPTGKRKWPSDQWVYWDEEPTTIQDDPEFSQFQALYSSPTPSHTEAEAPEESQRILDEIGELLGHCDIEDEDGNHECRWCHDYVEAGSKEGFRHDCTCPYEVLDRAFNELRKHITHQAGADSRIPGLVNGIRSLILFHTKNGTMHGDCASDFAELVAPYPSYAPSGEVIDEAAAQPKEDKT